MTNGYGVFPDTTNGYGTPTDLLPKEWGQRSVGAHFTNGKIQKKKLVSARPVGPTDS